ncbi:glycosyl transferase family 9 (putative heptosyltransferase) [Pseudomonas duriflava]|uniref:Glycosyl transferase family 9 (Putative heptosyltransferase) n=1 Tax=Pseudomonas duriflava TaxID=459528 RepID=A0A562QNM8_9PSED|nr:glycosyltransferase family 9 protein [Pseudomonas duriflava]TWI58344.1 glycosyl transferase family 9 (putative heptosyltransferase) [Pseudomonas duriflava]
MGMGDELMAAGQARMHYQQSGQKVLFVDRDGAPRWSEIWEHNPYILRQAEAGCIQLCNAPKSRPYIRDKNKKTCAWQPFPLVAAEVFFTEEELAFGQAQAQGAIVVEPHTKVPDSNKAWPWERWEHLVSYGFDFVQLGPVGTRVLPGVRHVVTSTFREAVAVLAHARAFVGAEGGLHHAAAAVSTPAVVLFSEFISPRITGYPEHINLYEGKSLYGNGARLPCKQCRHSMLAISVEQVAQAIESILRSTRPAQPFGSQYARLESSDA